MRAAKHISPAALVALVAALGAFTTSAKARVESDIAPAEKRRFSVELATRLSRLTRAEALPVELPNAFAPPQFELTDAEEAAAAAAAARQAALASGGPAVAAPPTDRELLTTIAAKIVPSGTFSLGGRPLLAFGNRFVRIGAHFTVTYKGSDYDLELANIDGSNFTLRYNHEEITRPVKTGKSP